MMTNFEDEPMQEDDEEEVMTPAEVLKKLEDVISGLIMSDNNGSNPNNFTSILSHKPIRQFRINHNRNKTSR